MLKTHKSIFGKGLKHSKVNLTEEFDTFETHKIKFYRGLKHA